MSETLLKVLPINDLLGLNFYVPSYQRGYRWTTRQVKELLDDIWEFRGKSEDKPKDEFYCLQPLVVAKQDEEWVLIDGQQRLTTIYLILSHLKIWLTAFRKEKYTIRYETRPDSVEFLNNIDLDKSTENIDYYHICQAYRAIDEWFKQKGGTSEMYFLTTLVNDDNIGKNVKVIWYEIGSDNNPIDIFTRINIGKIPLTNSELIKALFLGKIKANENDNKINPKQLQIANEWDRIENTLQNDSFWHFIYEGKVNYETRIEYIFDLMKDKTSEDEMYFTFHKFNDAFDAQENIDDIWLSIKKYFQTFEEWYKDRKVYHLVGYLIAAGYSIRLLKAQSEKLTKSKFKQFLIDEIKKSINYDVIQELDYTKNKDRDIIRYILLLFNIQTIVANDNSNIRFPFDSFKKEKNWDIEHIRSVKSDKPATDKKQRNWLESVLAYFVGKKAFEEQIKAIEFLKDEQDKSLTREICDVLKIVKITDTEFTPTYEKVLDYFKENSNPENINSISNLALLDAGTNRSYKNAVFPIKRKTIIEKDMNGTFIPICTKNVFLKSYSNQFEQAMFWKESDAEDYLAAILKTLSVYKNNQKDNNND